MPRFDVIDKARLGVPVSPLMPVTNGYAPERLPAIEVTRLKEAFDFAGVELPISVRVFGGDQIGSAHNCTVVRSVNVVKRVPQFASQFFGREDFEVDLRAPLLGLC